MAGVSSPAALERKFVGLGMDQDGDIRVQNFVLYFVLAEMSGVARDSIRNEGTREINYGII
jgi:hypothetical protein